MNNLKADVVVVGGGVAGMTAANALGGLGLDVIVVERGAHLGGNAARWACMATDECAKCSACVIQDLIAKTAGSRTVRVLTRAEVRKVEGEIGAYRLEIGRSAEAADGRAFRPDWEIEMPLSVSAAGIVLCTGFRPFDAAQKPLLGYGRFAQVITIADLDEYLREDRIEALLPAGKENNRIAFIQCVGSRDKKIGRDYCSQFCCKSTIRLSRKLLHVRPELQVTVYYIDLQIMGPEFRVFYSKLKDRIRFIQGVPAEVAPGKSEGAVEVWSMSEDGGTTVSDEYDGIVLATGISPNEDVDSIAKTFGVGLDRRGFLRGGDGAKPPRTSRPGIYAAGACAAPADIDGSRLQGEAVAACFLADIRGKHARQNGRRKAMEAAV